MAIFAVPRLFRVYFALINEIIVWSMAKGLDKHSCSTEYGLSCFPNFLLSLYCAIAGPLVGSLLVVVLSLVG